MDNKEKKQMFMNTKTYEELSEIGKKYEIYELDEEMNEHINKLIYNDTKHDLDINIPR